jgi:hypothetical protein
MTMICDITSNTSNTNNNNFHLQTNSEYSEYQNSNTKDLELNTDD